MNKIKSLYQKENPHYTRDIFYVRYVTNALLDDVSNGKSITLTGFTNAELELITKHAKAQLWELNHKGVIS